MEGLLRRLIAFDRLAKAKRASRKIKRASPPIPPVLKIVGLVVFAQTLFTRAVDPVIPQIAADLTVDVKHRRAAVDAPSRFPTRWCSRCSAPSATSSARPG